MNLKELLKIPPYTKILLVFLTLVGIWGAPGYEAPKFFTFITTQIPFLRRIFQFLFIFILAYQGLGNQDFKLTFWSTLIFFILFEIVKAIENLVWKDDIETPENGEDTDNLPAVNGSETQEAEPQEAEAYQNYPYHYPQHAYGY